MCLFSAQKSIRSSLLFSLHPVLILIPPSPSFLCTVLPRSWSEWFQAKVIAQAECVLAAVAIVWWASAAVAPLVTKVIISQHCCCCCFNSFYILPLATSLDLLLVLIRIPILNEFFTCQCQHYLLLLRLLLFYLILLISFSSSYFL